MGPGWLQIVIVIAVIVLLFGAKRIPDLAGSIGKGIKEFKKGVNDGDDSSKEIDSKKDS